jgi:hypothetical protein
MWNINAGAIYDVNACMDAYYTNAHAYTACVAMYSHV